MNLILLTENDFRGENKVSISDHRLTHLQQIHKARVGDHLRLGLINGNMGDGELISLSSDNAEFQVNLDQPPPQPMPLTLLLALPRPKMLRRILRNCAEFGIKSIYLINSYRVEKSYWQTPALQEDSVRQYLLEGLSQARDTVVPQVYLKRRFKPFVEDELVQIAEGSTALVAHPASGERCPHKFDGSVTLAIGPEGGFIPYEIELLCAHGFKAIHLGQRILRVENAVSAITAKLFD